MGKNLKCFVVVVVVIVSMTDYWVFDVVSMDV